MKSFEDWMHNKSPYGNVSIREAYNAGVKSRLVEVCKLQTEIDELQKKLAYQEIAYKNVKLQFLNKEDDFNELQAMYEKQGLYAFELQKLIDEALLNLADMQHYGNNNSIENIIDILEGNQNEN